MSKSQQAQEQESNIMIKISGFIVDKRNLFFLIYIILIIFSAFSRNWVQVENELSAYLPDTAETCIGLDLMEEQFTTYGTAKIMVTNIEYDAAKELAEEIEAMDTVGMLAFDNTADHYHHFSALYDITFAYDETDDKCLEALEELKEYLAGYDFYVSTALGDQSSETIASEMSIIVVWVAVIVVAVLLLTSQTWAEVPVLLLTFVSAAILSMGTNFVFGTISFVSNSVTVVLQLALSIDYAIILCTRYKEEHVSLPIREAAIVSLSKAIPEISSSSLTTVGGLIAMMFMQFGIGSDMAICLIKAIFLSLMSVFLLMPGLLVLFGNLMDKTVHKNFIPKIPFVGKFAHRTRFIVPPLFVAVLAVFFILQKHCPYVYGYSTLKTPLLNQYQIADNMIEESFGESNFVALIVPAGNYDKESRLLRDLNAREEVDFSIGLSNTEAMDGYMLTDKLSARQFSELLELDYEVAELLYMAYAVNDENYAKLVSGVSTYSVPLIDMIMFLYEEVEEGYVTLEDDLMNTLESAYHQMNIAREQLQGEEYSRMLIYLNLPEEGEETFAFLDEMRGMARKYYEEGTVLVIGESTSQYDLCKTFSRDNTVVNVVSILAVLAVLLFTFKSAGMPVLLIIVIQGSIWINFSFPALMKSNLFFMSYLIVSSIQMGANIDYAIVISGRFMELKEKMSKKDAIIETMNFAFPTIITSGSMLAIAGVLIGQMTSEAAIAGIGQCLGRGTFISIFIVMFILPQILLLGEKIIDKTSFTVSMPIMTQKATGFISVNGKIRGQVNGIVIGEIHGIVRGEINAIMEMGDMIPLDELQETMLAIEGGGGASEEPEKDEAERGPEEEGERRGTDRDEKETGK